MPNFIKYWKSLSYIERKNLKMQFIEVTARGEKRISDQLFFKRNKQADYSELEKDWWATKLNKPKVTLFKS